MIHRIEIQNFKAIRHAAVDLTPLHLLIGPNDSGKTSVLEALAAICRSVDHNATESFLGRWQGRELVYSGAEEPTTEIKVTLNEGESDLDYKVLAEFPTPTRKAIWKLAEAEIEEEAHNLRFDENHTLSDYAPQNTTTNSQARSRSGWPVAEKVAAQLRNCWYLRWSARNLALPAALNPGRRFRIEGNGFGLATVIDDLLNYDRERFAEMERQFVEIFPNVKAIALIQQQGFNAPVDQADETLTLQPAAGKQIMFRMHNTARDLPASQAAEGMLYLLGYLALMYLPEPPRVLLIEEPENGIHPHRVGNIVHILRQLLEKHPATQIVLTSHSPYLVDAFEPHEVTWCHRDNETGDVQLTRLDTLPEVQRSLDLFSLGEIWTGELEPHPAQPTGHP